MTRLGVGMRAFALALIPVALLLSHRNLVLVMVLVGVTGLASLRRQGVAVWSWPLLALVAYAALSTLWTPSARHASWAVQAPAFALLAAAALRVPATPGLARPYGLAVLIACVLLGAEAATGGLLRDLIPPEGRADKDDVATARGVGLAVLLLPAAALCLARSFGPRAAGAAGVLMAGCLMAGGLRFGVTANALALWAVIVAAFAAWIAPRATVIGLAGVFLLALAAAPFAAFLPPPEAVEGWSAGPVSWRMRIVIWQTVGEALWADGATALFGAGHHAGAALGEASGTAVLVGAAGPLPRVSVHPHDVFLQVWYEFGLVGAATATATIVLGTRRLLASAPPAPMLCAASALAAAAFVFLAIDASLWTLWRLAGMILGAVGLRLAAAPPSSRLDRRVVNQ